METITFSEMKASEARNKGHFVSKMFKCWMPFTSPYSNANDHPAISPMTHPSAVMIHNPSGSYIFLRGAEDDAILEARDVTSIDQVGFRHRSTTTTYDPYETNETYVRMHPLSVAYMLNSIFRPPCCMHSPQRLECDKMEEMDQYLERLPKAEMNNVKSELLQLAEKSAFPLAWNIRMKHATCPSCSYRESVLTSKNWSTGLDFTFHSCCPLCCNSNVTLLEILHRPEFWMTICENVYLSREVPVVSNDGKGVYVIFYVNLNRNRKTCAESPHQGHFKTMQYRGANWADLMALCPRRERVPTLYNLVLHRLATKVCQFGGGSELDNWHRVSKRTPLPRRLEEEVEGTYRKICLHTDLLEPLT